MRVNASLASSFTSVRQALKASAGQTPATKSVCVCRERGRWQSSIKGCCVIRVLQRIKSHTATRVIRFNCRCCKTCSYFTPSHVLLLHCLYVGSRFYASDLIYSGLRDDYRASALDTKSKHAGRGKTSSKCCEPVNVVGKENKPKSLKSGNFY